MSVIGFNNNLLPLIPGVTVLDSPLLISFDRDNSSLKAQYNSAIDMFNGFLL